MTEREARIAFNMIPTVGAVTLARLMAAAGGSAAAAYEAYPEKRDWEGREPAWEKEIEKAVKQNVRLVTELDPDYPPLLKETASPPLVLYAVGDVSVLSRAGVALVGTRRPTAYGRETAETFAAGLAHAGWAVFSGLAVGIDAAAHRGALAAGGATAAVLGGALDMFYPKENRALAREMVEKGGCVVSEFPFGRKPDMQTFPQRNRIVSGLARGVVAVECPLHSGTRITCMRAVEQGRSVMAVPGRIDWPSAAGCLELIREGARMVTRVEDILEEVTPFAPAKAAPSPRLTPEKAYPAGARPAAPGPGAGVRPSAARADSAVPDARLTVEEANVLRQVTEAGVSVDTVTRGAGLSAADTNALLVSLRLKGRIRFLPGGRVALSA